MPLSLHHRERWNLGLSARDWPVVAMVLTIKAMVLIYGTLSFQITNNERIDSLSRLISIWNQWDAQQYQRIAQHGYGTTGDYRLALVFYPLYPWIVRLITLVVRDSVVGALVVSGIASVVAGVALARLIEIDYSRRLARDAVWFLFIFPTSYFLHAGYSESLFLALVLMSFVAARREQWHWAGTLGAFAALARPNGILLVPTLAVEALINLHRTRRWHWQWLWIGAVPLGFAVYLWINYNVTGDPLAFLTLEREHWFHAIVPPWQGIWTNVGVSRDYSPNQAAMIGTQVLFYVALDLAGTIASAVLLRPSYTVWMALNWLLISSQSWDLSAPRYTLTMFPLFILIALMARARYWNTAITVWSLLWLGLFTSEFVRGHWAF